MNEVIVTVHSPHVVIMKSDEIYFFILWIKRSKQGYRIDGFLAYLFLPYIIHIFRLKRWRLLMVSHFFAFVFFSKSLVIHRQIASTEITASSHITRVYDILF